jgi:hypothetical protein
MLDHCDDVRGEHHLNRKHYSAIVRRRIFVWLYFRKRSNELELPQELGGVAFAIQGLELLVKVVLAADQRLGLEVEQQTIAVAIDELDEL